MGKLSILDRCALTLVILATLNTGLLAFYPHWNIVEKLLGSYGPSARIIYALFGLSALYLAATAHRLIRK